MRRHRFNGFRRTGITTVVVAASAGAAGWGCGLVLGIEDVSGENRRPDGGSAGTAGGGAGSSTGTHGGGSPQTTSSGPGGMGAGGTGGGGAGGRGWAERFGDAAPQLGYAVASDGANNVLVTGAFDGSLKFGTDTLTATENDVFIAKLDPSGGALWSKRFGGDGDQFGYSVATDGQNNVIFGGKAYGQINFGGGDLPSGGLFDAFMAKLTPNGDHLWSKRYGDDLDQSVEGVATDAAGNVLFTGRLEGSASFGGGVLTSAGGDDIYVVKLAPDGAHLWSKRFGDTADQLGYAIATDPSGNVFVTGSFEGTLSFGAGAALVSTGQPNGFLLKLSPAGVPLWFKGFGDADEQLGKAVATDPSGNVFLLADFGGTVDVGKGPLTSAGGKDVLLAKFSPTGEALWSKRFGDSDPNQFGSAVAADRSGHVFIAGTFGGSMNLGGALLNAADSTDIYVAELDANLNHVWSKRYGGPGKQFAYGLALDTTPSVLLTGFFDGTLDFGSGALTAVSDPTQSTIADLYVAKLIP